MHTAYDNFFFIIKNLNINFKYIFCKFLTYNLKYIDCIKFLKRNMYFKKMKYKNEWFFHLDNSYKLNLKSKDFSVENSFNPLFNIGYNSGVRTNINSAIGHVDRWG